MTAIPAGENRSYDLSVEGDVLLGDDPATDIPRVALLVRRVVEDADFLEHEHLDGADKPLGGVSRRPGQGDGPVKRGWHRHCRGCSDLETDAGAVVVHLGDGRTQQVMVVEEEEAYWLSSKVASRGIVESSSELALQAWRQNRATALVGFRIDKRQRLVGEAMVPNS